MSWDSIFFKGWAKPGPSIPRQNVSSLAETSGEISSEVSIDALCGHFRIFQLKKGHRFSTDDLLTAWYGTSWCPSARTALDLGSGTGSVGMISAWRLQGTRFTTIEAQEVSVQLARKSAQMNGITDRYEIRQGDFRDPAHLAPSEKFDLILGSPPYFPLNSGILGNHPQKVACRFEVRGSISDYCQVASEHLSWGGLFACVFPIQPQDQAQRVTQAAQKAGLTLLRQKPIIFKEGSPPLLSLFAMTKMEHLPETFRNQTWVESPLIIRTKSGSPHPEYAALKLSVGLPPT